MDIFICRENGQIYASLPVKNTSKPPSSIDSRRLSVARPSSPPPPPPPVQRNGINIIINN